MEEEGGMETEITKSVGSDWRNWREMQRSTVRQKDASEIEGKSIQNSDQASNAIRGRNLGYNEETRETD